MRRCHPNKHLAVRTGGGKFHRGETGDAQRAGRSRCHINYPSARERSAIVDPHHYRTTILSVCHTYHCSEWQRTMRRGQVFRIKRLAARRLSGLARMDRRDTGLHLALLCSGWGESQATGKNGSHREADDKECAETARRLSPRCNASRRAPSPRLESLRFLYDAVQARCRL